MASCSDTDDTEGQVQPALSAMLSAVYSVQFVYSVKNCHHMAIWLCSKYCLCHSNLMS